MATTRRALAAVLGALLTASCGAGPAGDAGRRAVEDGLPPTLTRWLEAAPESLPLSLARADAPSGYVVDTTAFAAGRIVGSVGADGAWPADTLSRPTHDLRACRPVPVAPLRGTQDGVGDVLVWLVGVTRGPADPAPRRAAVALEGCALTPSIVRVPRGTTLLVRNADSMESRLRFTEVGRAVSRPDGDTTAPPSMAAPVQPRALVPFSAPGAVTPLTDVANAAGLLRITDDHHPWVAGWLVVAPHPFVALSDEAGRFAFGRVPPGRYVLVAWHARLGATALPVLVEAGVEARVRVALPGAR